MPNVELKNNLKQFRALKGITQDELAQLVNVTRKTINVIEAGNYSPSVFLALSIADALDTTVDKIFFLKASEPSNSDS